MSEERTTAREIAQDKVNNEIMRAIGRLEGKVDSVLANQEELHKIVDGQEIRIDENEKAVGNIKIKIGLIGAVIGAIFSTIGDWLWRKVTGHQ